METTMSLSLKTVEAPNSSSQESPEQLHLKAANFIKLGLQLDSHTGLCSEKGPVLDFSVFAILKFLRILSLNLWLSEDQWDKGTPAKKICQCQHRHQAPGLGCPTEKCTHLEQFRVAQGTQRSAKTEPTPVVATLAVAAGKRRGSAWNMPWKVSLSICPWNLPQQHIHKH